MLIFMQIHFQMSCWEFKGKLESLPGVPQGVPFVVDFLSGLWIRIGQPSDLKSPVWLVGGCCGRLGCGGFWWVEWLISSSAGSQLGIQVARTVWNGRSTEMAMNSEAVQSGWWTSIVTHVHQSLATVA